MSKVSSAFDAQQDAFMVLKSFPIIAKIFQSLPPWLLMKVFPDGGKYQPIPLHAYNQLMISQLLYSWIQRARGWCWRTTENCPRKNQKRRSQDWPQNCLCRDAGRLPRPEPTRSSPRSCECSRCRNAHHPLDPLCWCFGGSEKSWNRVEIVRGIEDSYPEHQRQFAIWKTWKPALLGMTHVHSNIMSYWRY